MKFASVDIFELVTANDYALIAQLKDVRVVYSRCRGEAHDETGAVAAVICTFDDDPLEIDDDCVKIDGVLETHKTTEDAYGYWLCRV